MEIERKFLTVSDVMKRFNISRMSVYNHVKEGVLPRGVKIGNSRRWSIEEIEKAEKNFVTA